jgi:hypothetical protein
MKYYLKHLILCVGYLAWLVSGFPGLTAYLQPVLATPSQPSLTPEQPTQIPSIYTQPSLSFEANQGQTDPEVKFLVRGRGYHLFLTSTEAVWIFKKEVRKTRKVEQIEDLFKQDSDLYEGTSAVLRMQLIGANPQPHINGLDELPGKRNYFIGNDPDRWRTEIPTYGKVTYQDVYPGINLVYYSHQGHLEYDWVITPTADPTAIQFTFDGAEKLEIDPNGDLVLYTPVGEIRQQKPIIYQEIDGTKQVIPGRYVILNQEDLTENPSLQKDRRSVKIGFQLGTYVASKTLIIDPVLIYSTYLGGSTNIYGEFGRAIAVDTLGNVYVTGTTDSINFPTQKPFQSTFNGFIDAFVAKLDSTGSTLLYATYLGGSGRDFSYGIALDTLNNIYLTGQTSSPDFPLVNPLQPKRGGFDDAFVVKLNSSGSTLLYATYLGGSESDLGHSIAVDASGNAYITGGTRSTNFPVRNPLQPNKGADLCALPPCEDVFVVKLNSTGSALVYSTYLGGSGRESGYDIAVDTLGNAYIMGTTESTDFPTAQALQPSFAGGDSDFPTDAFVVKLNASGTAFIYSTYLGGSKGETGHGIAVDKYGNAYVTGFTRSLDFPTVNALQAVFGGGYTNPSDAFDAFVAKLNPTGSSLVFSTYLGGSDFDIGNDIAVDASGNIYVVCDTSSPDMPTANSIQSNFGGGFSDAFLAKLDATGSSIVYATYLGGNNDIFREFGLAVAVDAAGAAYIAGGAASTNFPTVNALQPNFGGGLGDAFIAKISDTVPVAYTADYDGDGKADIALYRPSTGEWLVLGTSPVFFGSSEDIPVPGDYDGNGTADFAFWRPSTGDWHVLLNGSEDIQNWGIRGDIPVPGDYDGDKKTDRAIWRPATGEWWISLSGSPSSNPINFTVTSWGIAGDIPTPADYDGDGKTDIAVFRPSNGTWYILNSSGGSTISILGQPGDFPVPGDYDGDGLADVAIWRSVTHTWIVLLKKGKMVQKVSRPGDFPVQADFDGDGRTDLGIFQASTGEWFILTSSSGFRISTLNIWGQPGDIPVAASGGR